MSLVAENFTIGTAVERVIPGLHYSQDIIIENREPASTSDAYAKAGFQYGLYREFTVNQSATAIFEVSTGAGGLQLDFYEILSTVAPVKADLIEGATVSTSGAAIPSYNLNRDFADDAEATFTAGTALAGGSVVASEYITADKHAVGGGARSGKIYTLGPNTDYAFRFVNKGNQDTVCFFQMTFAEKFNGANAVTIGDDTGNGFLLAGGERVQFRGDEGQSIYAQANDSAEIVVVRQN
jgi:hypothetical protein